MGARTYRTPVPCCAPHTTRNTRCLRPSPVCPPLHSLGGDFGVQEQFTARAVVESGRRPEDPLEVGCRYGVCESRVHRIVGARHCRSRSAAMKWRSAMWSRNSEFGTLRTAAARPSAPIPSGDVARLASDGWGMPPTATHAAPPLHQDRAGGELLAEEQWS